MSEYACLCHTTGLMYFTHQLSLPRFPTWSRLMMALRVRKRYDTPKYDGFIPKFKDSSMPYEEIQGLFKDFITQGLFKTV